MLKWPTKSYLLRFLRILSLAGSWQGLYRLLFSLGRLALYYETTDTRNMELNKIANEIVNEYMARELKEQYSKFTPA